MDIKDYIIYHSAGNLYWKDLGGRYLGCNKHYADLIGLPSPDDIVGKSDMDLFRDSLGEENVHALETLDQKVMREGIEVVAEELGIDKNYKHAYYLSNKAPLRDKENNIIGIIGTSLDVTKQKEAEKAKELFIQNMSHDIRTPFSGLQGITSVLYNQETDPEKKELIGLVLESATYLLNFLNEILALTRIGEMPIAISDFDIKKLIDEVISTLKASFEYKKLFTKINCPSLVIKTDRLRLYRIMLNLIGNAIKFTNQGGVTITVTTSDRLNFFISDTGKGIAKENLDRIFEQFYKETPSYKTSTYSGAGLGLYIVKNYIEDLGGSISVESQIDKGTTFKVSLNVELV